MTREEILSVAKPILFNTDMVRSILAGRKSTTRRVIKPRYLDDEYGFKIFTNMGTGARYVEKTDKNERGFDLPRYIHPSYQAGDYLYIREAWCWCPCWDCGMETEEHICCDETARKFYNGLKGEYGCYDYRASCADDEYPCVDTWHPSIHMPKEAARIFLRVTDVRVERLQDMTNDGAEKEGCGEYLTESKIRVSSLGHFTEVWNSTIPKKGLDKYGWNANPWVWVIQFEKVEV